MIQNVFSLVRNPAFFLRNIFESIISLFDKDGTADIHLSEYRATEMIEN